MSANLKAVVSKALVVDFFIMDITFPSGKFISFGENDLRSLIEREHPKAYVVAANGEDASRLKLVDIIKDPTVMKILSVSYKEITVRGYFMCYWHIRFLPKEGFWIV